MSNSPFKKQSVPKASRSVLEDEIGSSKEGVTPKAVPVAVSLYSFWLHHVMGTSLLFVTLKAEYVTCQNVVLNQQDYRTVNQLCVTEHGLMPSRGWRLLWVEVV